MNKNKLRNRMKALAISRFIVERNIKLRMMSEWQKFHASFGIESQALAINRMPSYVFRHDKPELDKRRWKRYNRKQMKGAYLVTANT